MRGLLVVVGPPLRRGGAERERAFLDEQLALHGHLGWSPRHRPGHAAELQRLGHRLLVLQLVLQDVPDREAVPQERILGAPVELIDQLERGIADSAHVGASRARRQDRQLTSLAALVREGVVDVVVPALHRALPADVAEQPQLLEVSDVRVVPDQRRHQWGHLQAQLLRREWLEQRLRPRPGSLQLAGESPGVDRLGEHRDESFQDRPTRCAAARGLGRAAHPAPAVAPAGRRSASAASALSIVRVGTLLW